MGDELDMGGYKYELTEQDEARLINNFTFHPAKEDQPERYALIREMAAAFAHCILTNCPNSRERQLALSKVEEAMMWANAGIARNE